MKTSVNLASLMELFVRRQGMEPLLADEQGSYRIVVDFGLMVECFERFRQLHLVSPLPDPPEPGVRRRIWLSRVLNYALYRMKQAHSTPVLLEDGSMALFARCGTDGMNIAAFEAWIEQHVNLLEGYQRVLADAESTQDVAPRLRSVFRP